MAAQGSPPFGATCHGQTASGGRLPKRRCFQWRMASTCMSLRGHRVRSAGGYSAAEDEDAERMKMAKLGGKCKEMRGLVELLESLETEAIMGGDEGRDPTDYNKRARIFDKSSRVFQALRDRATPSL